MNPKNKKKVIKRLENKFSAKQKAIKKQEENKKKGLQVKKSFIEKRKTKKLVKQEAIASQNAKAVKHKIKKVRKEPLNIPKLLTIADLWKEMMESSWTISMGLLKEELRLRNNKIIMDHVNKKKPKPYVPSTKAKAHHQQVRRAVAENERKREEHREKQQMKKQSRKQKNQLSLNRLVCIQKEQKMIRLRAVTAKELVSNDGWKYIAKKFWKKARTDDQFELYWDQGHINLNKVNEPNYGKLGIKQDKAILKDKQIKDKVNATATKNRKKRKGTKKKSMGVTISNFYYAYKNNPTRIMEFNGHHFVIDEEGNKYYRFSAEKLKELNSTIGTAQDIVEAIEAKKKEVEGFYSFGDLDSTYFLDLVCGNVGFEDEPKVTGIVKKDTKHNTFLLNGNTKKFYIFTKKHYLSLLKEKKSPSKVIDFVEGQGNLCVKVRVGKFSDEFFVKEQWPILKSKRPNFIKQENGSKIQEPQNPVREVAQNA